MKKNVGNIDRVIRFLLSAAFFSSYIYLEGNLKYLALVGFVPLLTATISFCPLYRILGLNSCKECRDK